MVDYVFWNEPDKDLCWLSATLMCIFVSSGSKNLIYNINKQYSDNSKQPSDDVYNYLLKLFCIIYCKPINHPEDQISYIDENDQENEYTFYGLGEILTKLNQLEPKTFYIYFDEKIPLNFFNTKKHKHSSQSSSSRPSPNPSSSLRPGKKQKLEGGTLTKKIGISHINGGYINQYLIPLYEKLNLKCKIMRYYKLLNRLDYFIFNDHELSRKSIIKNPPLFEDSFLTRHELITHVKNLHITEIDKEIGNPDVLCIYYDVQNYDLNNQKNLPIILNVDESFTIKNLSQFIPLKNEIEYNGICYKLDSIILHSVIYPAIKHQHQHTIAAVKHNNKCYIYDNLNPKLIELDWYENRETIQTFSISKSNIYYPQDSKVPSFSFKDSNQIYIYIKNDKVMVKDGGNYGEKNIKYYDPNTKRHVKYETAVKRKLILPINKSIINKK